GGLVHSSNSSCGCTPRAAVILPSVSNSGLARPFSIPLICFWNRPASAARPAIGPWPLTGSRKPRPALRISWHARRFQQHFFLAALAAIGAEVVKLEDI